MIKNIQLIAEVKTQSPFGWKSDYSWEELFSIANEFGDIISIHTDQRWGGSMDLLKKARSMTNKPILAKGIHTTDTEIDIAISCGADFVLVVGRIPDRNLEKCLIEPLNLDELRKIPRNLKVVWNSRDLKTGGNKAESFEEARKIFNGWLCQASNIRYYGAINDNANAILIGTYLKEFCEFNNYIIK